MIKANEIRLGNYLLTPKEQIFTVKAIDFDRLHDENGEYIVNHFSLHKCNPIELNEDILLKCGFENLIETELNEVIWFHGKTEYHIKINFNNIKGFWLFLDEQPLHPITVVFELHQLQNLYFALTGEELNIIL